MRTPKQIESLKADMHFILNQLSQLSEPIDQRALWFRCCLHMKYGEYETALEMLTTLRQISIAWENNKGDLSKKISVHQN